MDILNDVNKYAFKERNALSLGRKVKMGFKKVIHKKIVLIMKHNKLQLN